MAAITISGDVITAATALAGLILVYLGSIAASYGSFDATQQNSVRTSHQRRAWLAFTGLVLSLVSAALAVVGEWLNSPCCVTAATVILMLGFVWGIGSALLTVLEIR